MFQSCFVLRKLRSVKKLKYKTKKFLMSLQWYKQKRQQTHQQQQQK